MHQFPGPHFLPGLIEEALVVYFAHFLASFPVQPLPQRAILVVDPEILLLVGRRHFVGSEEETVRIAIDQFGSYLGRFGTRDNVLGHLVPRDIEVHMTELGIAKDLRNVRGMILYRADHSAHTRVRPDDGRVWMPLEKSFRFVQVRWWRVFLCKRHIHVVVDEHDESDLCSEIQNAIQRWVLETRNLARDLR